MAKSADPAKALVTVLSALDPLDKNDRQWVLQSAANRWSISLPVSHAGSENGGNANAAAVTAPLGKGNTANGHAAIAAHDARVFIRTKKPLNDVERVACLAYYIMKTKSQAGFTRKDINAAHTDSGGSNINMTRALDNATRQSKYLSNRGQREKQLTTVGEDVVEALPDRDAVAAVLAAARSGRKRPGRSKKSKTS